MSDLSERMNEISEQMAKLEREREALKREEREVYEKLKAKHDPAPATPPTPPPHRNPIQEMLAREAEAKRVTREEMREVGNPFLYYIGQGISESRPDVGKVLIDAAKRKDGK